MSISESESIFCGEDEDAISSYSGGFTFSLKYVLSVTKFPII